MGGRVCGAPRRKRRGRGSVDHRRRDPRRLRRGAHRSSRSSHRHPRRGSGARARAGWRRPDTAPLRALSPRRRSLARRRGGSQCRRRRSPLHPGAMDDRRRRRPGGIARRPGEISRRARRFGRHLSCRRAGPNESRPRDARGRSVAADAADVAGRVRREAAEQLSHLSMDDRAEHDPAPNGSEV